MTRKIIMHCLQQKETPPGPNTAHYKNSRVDSLYELGLRLTNFEERMKVYREIDKIILKILRG
jgi:ABC-type transport system substrate-binding protein